MKHILNIISCLMLSLIFCLAACKPVHQVIVHDVYETHIVDSVSIRDSVVTVPHEVYREIANKLDTLRMSTSLASAEAYLDTTNSMLMGKIWNKSTYTYEKEVVDHYYVKDSIVEKPVPYPVEVEVKNPVNGKLVWWGIISSLGCLACICFIFRKPLMKLFGI